MVSVLGADGAGGDAAEAAGSDALTDALASDRIAEEQAALRRVAVLVSEGAPPEKVFATVAAEAGGCWAST